MVQAGTLFGYLAAFVTIVLALALSDLLISVHRLLRARKRVHWRPLPLVLATFVALSLLTCFFELWDLTRWTSLSYYGLLWQVVQYVPIFLAASAVLPDEVPEDGLDLDQFYFAERRYIVALLAIAFLFNAAGYLVGQWGDILTRSHVSTFVLTVFLPMNLLTLAAFAAISWSGRKWLHWISFLILFGLAHVGYSDWVVEGASALAR